MIFFIPNVHANETCDITSKEPMSLEEIYKKCGYSKDIGNVINEYETKFKTTINLPKQMPFKVKMRYGKTENKRLHIAYFGENKRDILTFYVDQNSSLPGKSNHQLKSSNKALVRDYSRNELNSSVIWMHIEHNTELYSLGLVYHDKESGNGLIVKTGESLF